MKSRLVPEKSVEGADLGPGRARTGPPPGPKAAVGARVLIGGLQADLFLHPCPSSKTALPIFAQPRRRSVVLCGLAQSTVRAAGSTIWRRHAPNHARTNGFSARSHCPPLPGRAERIPRKHLYALGGASGDTLRLPLYGPGGPRLPSHPRPARGPAHLQCRGRPLDRTGGRERGSAAHLPPRRRGAPLYLPRRKLDRLRGRLRRQPGCLRHPGRGRRAQAADLAPGQRRAGRLDTRRQSSPDPQRSREPAVAARHLHRAARGGRAGETPHRWRALVFGRSANGALRLHPQWRRRYMEAVPRRHGRRHLGGRPHEGRLCPRHDVRRHRHRTDVARRPDILPLRSGRHDEPLVDEPRWDRTEAAHSI